MRLEVSVDINSLPYGEHGSGEVARLLREAALMVLNGFIKEPGDFMCLADLNGSRIGFIALHADWAVGEELWATTREGSLIESTISHIAEGPLDGYKKITLKSHTGEPMTPILVNQWGHGVNGEPLLGRRS